MAKPLVKMDNLRLDSLKRNLQYVVAVDESNCARNALRWADFLANKNDKINIVHSYEKKENAALVSERYGKYPKRNNERFSLEILDDECYNMGQRIKHYVNKGQKQIIDMLVTGYHGVSYEEDNSEPHIGSTSDLSLRSARCSSFFVKKDLEVPEDQSKLKIVVGVDGSQNSVHAFEFAKQLLAPNNTIYIVHIQTEYSNKNEIPDQYKSENVIKNYTKHVEEAKKELGFKVTMEIKLVKGTVKISHALCKFVEDNKCHILCVGADGMTAYCNKQPILGSVSDECVKDCPCNTIVTQVNEYNATPRGSFNQK
eukprot:722606_1